MINLANTTERATNVEMAFAAACAHVFPSLSIKPIRAVPDGKLVSRSIAGRTLARVRCVPLVVEASTARAQASGLDAHFKIMWLTSGRARLSKSGIAMRLVAGQMVVLPVATDYRLEVEQGFEAVTLTFDPRFDPHWSDRRRQVFEAGRWSGSAVDASAASANALLGLDEDEGSRMVLDSILDLAAWSALEPKIASEHMLGRSQGFLDRARQAIGAQIDDPEFSPSDLAHQLGMSRRALYTTFARFGTTPAAYMRDLRLEYSHRDIVATRGEKLSLTDVALRYGFTDSATFSRAFRAKYGAPPSELRVLS